METDYINLTDTRSYALPIANIIGKRINHIATLNNKLTRLVNKLYLIPDEEDKNEICSDISKIISEIELLILKNIDDAQVLEYTLATLTTNPAPVTENVKKSDSVDHHLYA